MTADNMIKEIETIENIRYKLSCLFASNKFTANNKISTTEYTAHKDNKHYMFNVNSDASYTCKITSNVVEFEQHGAADTILSAVSKFMRVFENAS